jgi:hypothetical protein
MGITILEGFLQDIAQGVYGPSDLDYEQIYRFFQLATEDDLATLKLYFWDFTSEGSDDVDLYQLESFIESVIN